LPWRFRVWSTQSSENLLGKVP